MSQLDFLCSLLLFEQPELFLKMQHIKPLLLFLKLLLLLEVVSSSLFLLLSSLHPSDAKHIFMLLGQQFMHIIL